MSLHGEKRKTKAYNHINGYTDDDSESGCMVLRVEKADVKLLTGKDIEMALMNGTDDDETSSSVYFSIDDSDHDEKLKSSKNSSHISPINENCKVSPLKLKRRMEYAVDKVSSSKNSNNVSNKNDGIVTPKRTPMAQVNENTLEKLTPRRSSRKQILIPKEETPTRRVPPRKSKVLASQNLLDSSLDEFEIGKAIKGCGRSLRGNKNFDPDPSFDSSSETDEELEIRTRNLKLNSNKNTPVKKIEERSSKLSKTPLKKAIEIEYLEGIAPLEIPEVVKTPKSTKKVKNSMKCETRDSFDDGIPPLGTPSKKTPLKKEASKSAKKIDKLKDTPIRKSRKTLKSEISDEEVEESAKTSKSNLQDNKKTTENDLLTWESESEDEKTQKSSKKIVEAQKIESSEKKVYPTRKRSIFKKDEISKIDFSDEDEPKSAKKAEKRKIAKKDSDSDDDFVLTPRTRRRTNINYSEKSPKKTPLKTPSRMSLRRKVLEANTPKMTPETKNPQTPITPKNSSARKKLDLTPTTPHSLKKVGHGFLTPVITEREKNVVTPKNDLDYARSQLQVATLPSSLPCREKEYQNIKSFLVRKLEDMTGGCMYISGVPGTGKTATVHTVVKHLQQSAQDDEIPVFDFVEINGLRLTEPKQAYVRIWQTLTKAKLTSEQALKNLEAKYNGKNKRSTILLVDELDYLCNKRQDVIYNILDWTTKRNSKLIVLTIANTMDLPERTLKGKVSSRMGLTRLVFHPYTYQQLQEIVMNRLNGCKSFQADAVQLVSRKVAAVSGDARRALDICRRSTELLKSKEDIVTVEHIQKALTQIFAGVRVQAIKNCSAIGKLILKSLKDEVIRTGVEESTVGLMLPQLIAVCAMDSCPIPTVGEILTVCSILADSGLIIAEKGRGDLNRKLSLNVSPDDIHYAISCS